MNSQHKASGKAETNKPGNYLLRDPSRQELKERLRHCVEIAGSGNALADQSGIPRRTLESYLAGHAEPKASRLAAIVRATGIDGHWLLTGEKRDGKPLRESTAGYGPSADGDLVWIPYYDMAATGVNGAPTHETAPCSHLAFGRSWLLREVSIETEHLMALRAEGESMAPVIHPGDVLLVDRRDHLAQREGIYVLSLDTVLLVKRLQHLPGRRLLVKSEHPAYEPYELHRNEIEKGTAAIIGRVVWSGHRL